MNRLARLVPLAMLSLVSISSAQIPPPTNLVDFPFGFTTTVPSAVSYASKTPAGADGPVVVRDGHFYTGEKRIRFLGVNVCFAACFPTHAQADAIAERLAHFGINAMRFHHMDNQVFPGGIFADAKLEKLSDEALDRLDYFISTLAKRGIYSNINLHVSRHWSKSHNWPSAGKTPDYDKMIDLFTPELVEANKQFARDLLTRTNKYTNQRYADDPAICMVEINNENTLFLWGADKQLRNLAEPHAGLLQKLWNEWLVNKYKTRESLAESWGKGVTPLGENFLRDPEFKSDWQMEQHAPAKMSSSRAGEAIRLQVSAVDGTGWHLQFKQNDLKIRRSEFYTLRFTARSDKPCTISVGVGQAHAPWLNLGLSTDIKLTPEAKEFQFGFLGTEDDDQSRLSFVVGQSVATIDLSKIELRPGGQQGLTEGEDPTKGTVKRYGQGIVESRQRRLDWYDFLQTIDEKHFVEMREFLKTELGVKAPITGTIGLGPLSTASQSKMDFVDAHDYWDHPNFPNRPWDMNDWLVDNQPMVRDPEGATLWRLASTRVKGKPFTVTEYNHSAPNEWAAEGIPLFIATAALQDWDGLFIFAYSHGSDFEKQYTRSFFDIEGNVTKMPLMPLAARLFTSGSIEPLKSERVVSLPRLAMLDQAVRNPDALHSIAPLVRELGKLSVSDFLSQRIAIDFNDPIVDLTKVMNDRQSWQNGRYTLRDPRAAIFVGFTQGMQPIDLGEVKIESIETPFASIMVVPADPKQSIADADRLLLAAVARAENTNQKWQRDRRSLGSNWGKGPSRIEVVKGKLSVQGRWNVYALTAQGTRGEKVEIEHVDGLTRLPLGTSATVWYECVREK